MKILTRMSAANMHEKGVNLGEIQKMIDDLREGEGKESRKS